MKTLEIIPKNRVLFFYEEVLGGKQEYEDIVKWGLQKAEFSPTKVMSEYTEGKIREESIKIDVVFEHVFFSTFTPPANGYIAPQFLWSFLNQILDYLKPDNEYYFCETYDLAIAFVTKQEFKMLMDNDLLVTHSDWTLIETKQQLRFKHWDRQEITNVTIR